MHGAADTSGNDLTEPLPRGYRVGGWQVTEPIGAGGWATVYGAHPVGCPAVGAAVGAADGAVVGAVVGAAGPEEVALKILPTAGLAPRQARKVAETARREVELGRRAGHPRLIRLLDSLMLREPDHPFLDGAIVLVMERAAGSLRDLLDTAVTETEAARLFAEICEGLVHLHRSGWVHGDLKPDNVLLMADGSVKLSDFGLATEMTGTHGTHGYGPPMGTLDYLPPERWKAPLGEHGVQVRPSADIWALGIMIHEVFASGASPFPGATPGARGAATQEYADGRALLRMDNAVPPFWRALAADCLAPTHAARAAHTADSLLTRITTRQTADTATDTTTAAETDRDTETEPTGEAAETVAGRPSGRPYEQASGFQASGQASGRASARRRKTTRTALAAVAACTAAAAIWAYAVRDGASGTPAAAGSAGAVPDPAGRIQVFNAEQRCRDRTDRDPQCSLGLAIDPLKLYTSDNVVPTRVWHGDVLAVDCRLPLGIPIIDEADAQSADWFRVRLPADSDRPTAWLPAVRTKDRPEVPDCPRPTPVR
ncbi:serine/threonine-protein kinase [Streptomyces sp. NPDC002990]